MAADAIAGAFFTELGNLLGGVFVLSVTVLFIIAIIGAAIVGWYVDLSRREGAAVVLAGLAISVFGSGSVMILGVAIAATGAFGMVLGT